MAPHADLLKALRARLPHIDMHLGAPCPAPCTLLDPARLPEIEARIGLALPALYTQVLTRLGNGGFGPGYGIMGLGPGGFLDDMGHTADALYELWRTRAEQPPYVRWPEGLFPICHFGCAIYHCVEVSTGLMLVWEPNVWDGGSSMKTAIFPAGVDLRGWLQLWADGGDCFGLLHDADGNFRTEPLRAASSRAPRKAQKPHPDQLSLFD